LISAYLDYTQRAEVYDAVAQSLFGFVKDAATSNRLLSWLGVSALIGFIDAQPWAANINAAMLPGRPNQHRPIHQCRPGRRRRRVVPRVDRRRPDSAAAAAALTAACVAAPGAERATGPIRIRALLSLLRQSFLGPLRPWWY
jgi:hypothetical protein